MKNESCEIYKTQRLTLFLYNRNSPSPSDYREYPNYCVSSSNKDLPQTNHPAGDTSIGECQIECNANMNCSAFEWYEMGWDLSKCKLMLGHIPATKGSSRSQWQDAKCYVKTAKGMPYKYTIMKI